MKNGLHISDMQHRIAVSDDEQAYRQLFIYFAPRLRQFSFSICHQMQEAEEVVSDVFLRIWEKRKTLDHIHNLKLYLYIAVRNHSLNRKKAGEKRQALNLDDLQVDLVAPQASPDISAELNELQQQVHAAVQSLPPQCKLVFKLQREDGLKQKEVAELLNLQPKTVENHLSLALKKIAGALTTVSGQPLRRRTVS